MSVSEALCKTRFFSVVKKKLKSLEIVCFMVIVLCFLLGTVTFVLFQEEVPEEVIWTNKYKPPCGKDHPEFSVSLKGAKEDSEGHYRAKDGVLYVPGTFYKSGDSLFGCPCLVKPCVRKCCDLDGRLDLDSDDPPPCVKTNSTPFKPFKRKVYTSKLGVKKDLQLKYVHEDHFVVLEGDVCDRGYYLLNESERHEDRNFLMEDGRIIVADDRMPLPLDQSQYCLESFLGEGDTIYVLVCFPKRRKAQDIKEKKEQENEKLEERRQQTEEVMYAFAVAMITSIVLLLVTLLILALLPEVRRSRGTSLMGYIVSLVVAFGALSLLQLGRNSINTRKRRSLCVILALVVQCAYLSSILWLNVMSFYIWRKFREPPQARTLNSRSCKRFMLRCIYVYGISLLVTFTTGFMEWLLDNTESIFKPNIGHKQNCWFGGYLSLWLYFYLPATIILTVNLFMFLTTSCRIHSQDNAAAAALRSTGKNCNQSDRNRLRIYLRLFIVMGVSWLYEPASYYIGGSRVYWLLLFDSYNALQGLVIFYLSVWQQPDLLRQLRERFRPPPPGAPARRQSMATFRAGSVSSASTVQTSPI